MLDEAKSTRERVLADLFRRRGLLQAQVDELRSGRDNLLDAYRVVKRTFLEATAALAQVEARAAERATHAGTTRPTLRRRSPPRPTSRPSWIRSTPNPVRAKQARPKQARRRADDEEATDPSLADVDSLFARIRAGQAEAPIADAPSEAVDEVGEPVGAPPPRQPSSPDPRSRRDRSPSPNPRRLHRVRSTPGGRGGPRSSIRSWWRWPSAPSGSPRTIRTPSSTRFAGTRAARPPPRCSSRRPSCSRRGSPSPRDAIDEAYRGGRIAAGGEPSAVERRLRGGGRRGRSCCPVRERIAAAIDAGEEGDTGGLVERIGARFREWKNQALENALADALAMSWSRGVYDGSPDGTVLRWIPLVEGRCADCDDNGLEPTVKGSSFPTGQAHPPAHPGCRCLLAPADVLSGLAANA